MRSWPTLVAVALATAAVGVSCGEVARHEGPTAPVTLALTDATDDETGGVAARAVSTELLCHLAEETGTWSELEVPDAAVDGHLGHGDYAGPCAVPCPCFTAEELDTYLSSCNVSCFSIAEDSYLAVTCGGGVDGEPIEAFTLGSSGTAAVCYDGSGPPGIPVTTDQHVSCQTLIQSTGRCI